MPFRPRVRHRLDGYLKNGGLLSTKTRKSFVDFMARADPKVADRLEALSRLHDVSPELSATARETLAFEKEAVGLLFDVAGIDREVLLTWRKPTSQSGAQALLPSGVTVRRRRAHHYCLGCANAARLRYYSKERTLPRCASPSGDLGRPEVSLSSTLTRVGSRS